MLDNIESGTRRGAVRAGRGRGPSSRWLRLLLLLRIIRLRLLHARSKTSQTPTASAPTAQESANTNGFGASSKAHLLYHACTQVLALLSGPQVDTVGVFQKVSSAAASFVPHCGLAYMCETHMCAIGSIAYMCEDPMRATGSIGVILEPQNKGERDKQSKYEGVADQVCEL